LSWQLFLEGESRVLVVRKKMPSSIVKILLSRQLYLEGESWVLVVRKKVPS